jgi:hypothetical protein
MFTCYFSLQDRGLYIGFSTDLKGALGGSTSAACHLQRNIEDHGADLHEAYVDQRDAKGLFTQSTSE